MRRVLRRLRHLASELKRRRIFRAAVVYATVAFVVLQAAGVIFPALHLPSWALTLLVVVAILGFPLVLALEWVYEITSEGIRREPDVAGGAPSGARNQERSPPGEAETAAAGSHDADRPLPHRPIWRRPMAAVPAIIVLLLFAGSFWGLRRGPPGPETGPEVSPTAVAVLPFSVRGGEDAHYLGEGMVSLLGTALDGAGPLRAVDPRALFGTLEQVGGAGPAVERGRRVAARLGAGLFVLGDIVESGGRFHIEGGVYEVSGEGDPLVRAAVSGSGEALFELVDELAAGLVAGIGDGPTDRLSRTAAATTSSFAAFASYLDGESHIRAGRPARATESYLEALSHDSTFALAYYRLAVARDWAALPGMEEAARSALRYAERLSLRDRGLLEGFEAYIRGDAPAAERRIRDILARYPDDVEAWYLLGEVLFHYGPLLGRSQAQSEVAWRRVLSFEPRNIAALTHMAQLASLQDRGATVDSMVALLTPEGDTVPRWAPAHFRQALTHRDTTQALALARETDGWEEAAVWQFGAHFSARPPDAAGTARVLEVMDRPHLSPGLRGDLRWFRSALFLATGRRALADEARAAAVAAASRSPSAWHRGVFELLTEWSAATLPLPNPDSVLVRVRREAAEARPPPLDLEAAYGDDPPVRVAVWADTYGEASVFEAARHYTVGIVSLRLGEPEAAARSAEELALLAASEEAPLLVRDLERGLRAHMAHDAGHPAEGLRLLEELEVWPVWLAPAVVVPYVARGNERYLRGVLLAELGRDEEALAWLESLGQLSVMEIPLGALAHLRRAEIHERRGELDRAAEQRERFRELWREADPEFRSGIEGA